MSAYYHLAELNLAQASGADLADFYAMVPEVNKLAERSPGFVWRDVSDGGVLAAEPGMLVNLSVWESVDALEEFTYRGRHLEVFRNKAKWFRRAGVPMMVAWWVPAGHEPSPEEARARLMHLREHGPSAVAFSFAQPFGAPPVPDEPAVDLAAVDLDGRLFESVANTENGDVGAGSQFVYRQRGRRIWSVYEMAGVRFGTLVARLEGDGEIDMRYQQLSGSGVRTGVCRSRIERLSDGRLRLHERWRWLDGDGSEGESVLEEVSTSRRS